MFPELIKIGDFTLRSFGVALVISFFFAIALGMKRAPRFGIKPQVVQDSALFLIFGGILGARITYIVLNWKHFAAHPNEIFALQMEGLTSFGGMGGGVIGMFIAAKKYKFNPLDFIDLISVPFLLAHSIGRIGCFLNGCCVGHACETSPPGMKFTVPNGIFLPAQLYDAGMVVLGLFAVMGLERKFPGRGSSIGWTLIVYGVSRFIYEYWRIGESSFRLDGIGLSQAQIASFISILIGVVFVVRSFSRLRTPAEVPA